MIYGILTGKGTPNVASSRHQEKTVSPTSIIMEL
jgi:hypothetical protein